MAKTKEFDPLDYEAEQQVVEALKASPQVKKEIRRVRREIKRDRARIKKAVLKNTKSPARRRK